jgi:hypothetical protein
VEFEINPEQVREFTPPMASASITGIVTGNNANNKQTIRSSDNARLNHPHFIKILLHNII